MSLVRVGILIHLKKKNRHNYDDAIAGCRHCMYIPIYIRLNVRVLLFTQNSHANSTRLSFIHIHQMIVGVVVVRVEAKPRIERKRKKKKNIAPYDGLFVVCMFIMFFSLFF